MNFHNLTFALVALLSLAKATPISDIEAEESYNATISARDLAARQAGHRQTWPGPNYEPHFTAPYCRDNRPENGWECILTSRMPPGNPLYFEIYLFDHNCLLLGYDLKVPYWEPWGLTSQLPYLVTVDSPTGGQLYFRYANKYIEPKEYTKYSSYNTGDGKRHELLPASQIFWNCSLDH